MINRDMYYIYDSPVPYLAYDKELLIYPVTMRDYNLFYFLSSCLMLEKNSVADVAVISMSYLQYLFSISNSENKMRELFDALLRLVLKKPDMKARYFIEDKKAYFELDGIRYDSNDFMNIKDIISEQNALQLPDERIQKSVRDKMEEARRYKEKHNKSKVASVEDQIIALSIYSGWEMKTIYDMTIRKFIKSINRANHMIYSQMYIQASMSGMVEFKDKSVLKGWLSSLDVDDRDLDVKVDLEKLRGQVDFSSAK